MSKYKEEIVDLKNTSKGWTKNGLKSKYYYKNNWIIACWDTSFVYYILDESYEYGCYLTRNKQDFLEEKHMFKLRKTPVWKALHGEYKDE